MFCTFTCFSLSLLTARLLLRFLLRSHERMQLLRPSVARYQKRIIGPLLDRIDIHVEVPRVDYEKLADKRQVENSATRKCVQSARERQLQRFSGTRLTRNAEIGPSEVRDFCNVEPSAEKLLKAVMQQLHLSASDFHRVLKLALPMADLAD